MERRIDLHLRISYEPRVLRPWLVLCLLLVSAGELGSENVTLTTYYPAPSGAYTKMITTSDTLLARDTGSVGIGTPTPAYKLDVVGDVQASGSVWWGSGAQRTETKDNAGAIASRSGFFQTSAPTNYYPGAAGWQHLIESRHTNPANNYALQIAGSFFDQKIYFRKTNNSAATAWNRFTSIPGWVTTGSYIDASASTCTNLSTNNGTCGAGTYATWSQGVYVDNGFSRTGPVTVLAAVALLRPIDVTFTSPVYYCCVK